MIHRANACKLLPLVLAPLFFLASCGADGPVFSRDLRAKIASSDAVFEAVFPPAAPDGADVRCAGTRNGAEVTLTVTGPERLSGFTVTMTRDHGGGFSVTLGGADFPAPAPVDPKAARALTDVFAILYGDAEETSPSPDKSERSAEAAALFLPTAGRIGDGESGETVFHTAAGDLVCGENGVPVRVVCPDFAGTPRTVLIENYTFTSP